MDSHLTPFEKWVIEEKGTEPKGSGLFINHNAQGFYHCKKCQTPLYSSEHKFPSTCGWPSFDDELPGAVKRIPDPDGRRTEILCQNCDAHLGHVFEGEGYTAKNIRHCVNSVSMTFKPAAEIPQRSIAIFASGCFWGTEYFMARIPGVISTEVGYIGGHKDHPTYEEVCSGKTGHFEAVRVTYNPLHVTYRTLVQIFFETHDFSQEDGQGPDIGSQYLSRLFPIDDEERSIAEEVIGKLKLKGFHVATQLLKPQKFWSAEDNHQKYYEKQGKSPYCHIYRPLFSDAGD